MPGFRLRVSDLIVLWSDLGFGIFEVSQDNSTMQTGLRTTVLGVAQQPLWLSESDASDRFSNYDTGLEVMCHDNQDCRLQWKHKVDVPQPGSSHHLLEPRLSCKGERDKKAGRPLRAEIGRHQMAGNKGEPERTLASLVHEVASKRKKKPGLDKYSLTQDINSVLRDP